MKERDKTATSPTPPKELWLSGRFIPWEQATVHISQIAWSAISAVFEGIRCYWSSGTEELFVFMLDEHLRRFETSMKLMRMAPSFTREQLAEAITELVRRNDLRQDAYVQPLAYFGGNVPGYLSARDLAPEILLLSRPVQSFLGAGRAFRCGVSSWGRISDNVMPPRAKAIANYQNSRTVSTEATLHGYDAGIILNQNGKVAEGAYACLFLIRDGVAITPSLTSGILESITRRVLLELLSHELGMPVEEREVDRTELYVADEILLCGTFAEITPVVAVDHYTVGDGTPGPITRRLEALFHELVRGVDLRHPDWRTPIWAAAPALMQQSP